MVCFKNFKKSLKRELGVIENIPDTEDTHEELPVVSKGGQAEIS